MISCRFISTLFTELRKMSAIVSALLTVQENINYAHQQYCETIGNMNARTPLLVAVSKTKPNEMIIEAYNNGQRHFGENYVQELIQKANYFNECGNYADINWHFIGHLQKNKVNNLLGAPNICVIETVDSIKLAEALNKSLQKCEDGRTLKVFAQVNVSGEINKSGVTPEDCVKLVDCIHNSCDRLELQGLMTIGSFNHDYSKGPNPDFTNLVKCRETVCEELSICIEDLQLSMGMSNDYQQALEVQMFVSAVQSLAHGVDLEHLLYLP